MATITITVQSLLNAAQYDPYTVSDGITVATLKSDIQTATGVDVGWFNLVFNDEVLVDGNTLVSYSIIDGSSLRSGNIIDSLPTLQDRQIAKLDLASLDRNASGNPYFIYDIDLLPSKYIGNVSTPNSHPDGLVQGRPWISIVTSGLSMYLDANNPDSYSGSGTTWADLSGNGFDQTLIGAPIYTSGTPSYFSFNGVSQYSVGSTPYVLPPNFYTKMVWFQISSAADNNLVSSQSGGHFMYFAGTSTLWAGNANQPPYAGGGAFGSVTGLSYDTWYCAAVVFTSPQIYLYINGVQNNYDLTYTMTGHGGDGSVNLACFAPGGNLLNGKIAEVFCYGRALSAAEILQNFNATKATYGL